MRSSIVHRMDARPDETADEFAKRLVVAGYMTNGFVFGWRDSDVYYSKPGYTREHVMLSVKAARISPHLWSKQ